MKSCANCNGSGQVAQAVSDSQTLHKCSFCDGEGAVLGPDSARHRPFQTSRIATSPQS